MNNTLILPTHVAKARVAQKAKEKKETKKKQKVELFYLTKQ